MENMKLESCEPVVYIKEEHTNISALNPIDLNIQDEEDEIGDKSEHKVYCSLTVVNPEEITYDSLGSDDYNSDWVFGLQSSDVSHHNQQIVTIKNNESSQQSVIECDLSNDSTYSRLNDNSSSDNSSMYTYFSLPNDSSLVSFSHQEPALMINKRVDFNDWNNKHVPEQKKVVSKVVAKAERSPPVKKTFACPICNKIFASKSNLERHGVVHSDVKPFQCVECKRMFSRRVHLERHKFLHMDQKPFNCEICKKGFNQKAHLEKHQYIHTGIKPFPCTQCEKSFARKESLNRHKNIHEKEMRDALDNKVNNTSLKIVSQNVDVKKEVVEDMDTSLNKDNKSLKTSKVETGGDENMINSSEKENTEDAKSDAVAEGVIDQEASIKDEITIEEDPLIKEEIIIKEEKRSEEIEQETNNVEQMDTVESEEKTE